eukprot:m.188730 g.188730  ORF g.188730 m.188730 type:complete len:189 (-) comp16731_c1_seq1:75-641(-)
MLCSGSSASCLVWSLGSLLGIVHALVAVCGAVHHTLWTDVYSDTIIKFNYRYHFYLSFSIGYFLVDLVLLAALAVITRKHEYFSLSILLHHVISLFAVWYALFVPASFLAAWLLLTEGSTPFVDLRVVLKLAGLKDTKVYYFNCVMLVTSFFVLRVAGFAYYWWRISLSTQVTCPIESKVFLIFFFFA